MSFGDLPLVGALKTKMRWHQERQKLLAENVANADTPGFQGRDLKLPEVGARTTGRPVSMAVTQVGHMTGRGGSPGFRADGKPNFETTPNGNAVSLEEQMMRVSENQMDYQAVTGLYQRGLAMMRTALGRRQ